MSGVFDFSGQWVGYGEGDPAGDVVLDLDPDGDQVVGTGYLFLKDDLNDTIPCSAVKVAGNRYDRSGLIEVSTIPFDARVGYRLSVDEVNKFFPGAVMPRSSRLKYSVMAEDQLKVEWESDIGTRGRSVLHRGSQLSAAERHVEKSVRSWDEFKEFVSAGDPNRLIYRGQAHPYPLKTSFHRTKRKDLLRYVEKDIPILHRALSSKTKHFFDLSQPQQMGAFLNLAQHHGFPTPLLDWSYSPYVAAYFAFSNVRLDDESDESVRIFCLDKEPLVSAAPQFQHLTYVYPHLSILEALSLENDRAVPQQGLLTLTNLEDIERFLSVLEVRIGQNILTTFDIPKSETRKAMADLRLMGISRSSLFPGIESICLDTRDRLF